MLRTLSVLALVGLFSLQSAAKSMEQTSALIYYKQGDYKKALEFAEAGRDANVQEALLYSLLVELYANQGRYDEMNAASALIEKVADTEKNIQKARKTADEHIHNLWVPQFNNGVNSLSKANSEYEAGDSTACRASYDQAIIGFAAANRIKPADHMTRKALANTWRTSSFSFAMPEKIRRVEEAVAVYNALLAEHPDSSAFQLEIVKLWDIPRDSRRTIEAAEAYLATFAPNSEVLKLAGYAHSELANTEEDEAAKKQLKLEAIDYMQKALALSPENPDLSFDMAFLYGQVQDYEKSLSQYGATLALKNLDGELVFECHKQMGLVALMASQDSEDESWLVRSIEAYEKAFAIHPDNSHVRNNLGIALLRLGAARGDDTMVTRGNSLIGG
jgi:tetratricopeptide (TPR) repeat protein